MISTKRRAYAKPQFARQQRLSEITAQMKVSGPMQDNTNT